MESQPQNPKFRNNPENFHLWDPIFSRLNGHEHYKPFEKNDIVTSTGVFGTYSICT